MDAEKSLFGAVAVSHQAGQQHGGGSGDIRDAVGEVAFVRSSGLAAGLALGGFAVDVEAGVVEVASGATL